jgi:hypothetical protein
MIAHKHTTEGNSIKTHTVKKALQKHEMESVVLIEIR